MAFLNIWLLHKFLDIYSTQPEKLVYDNSELLSQVKIYKFFES